MRIRRLGISLPPRFKGTAERDARLIAQQIAESLGPDGPARVKLQVAGRGAPGHAIAQQVGRQLGALGGRKG